MQFEFQQQLSSQPASLKEEQEHQQSVQVSLILIVCTEPKQSTCPCLSALLVQNVAFSFMFLMFSCLVLQQLEEQLQQSKEELNQLKSDLQENVELVGL